MRAEREAWGDLRDRPLGDLLGELGREGQALVRDELRMARAELREELDKVKAAGVRFGAGGAVAYAALLLLGATLILIGARFLPAWLSALIVTAIYAAVGAGLVAAGRSDLKEARPARAAEHLEEDGRWLRDMMRHVGSSRGASGSRSSRARYPDA